MKNSKYILSHRLFGRMLLPALLLIMGLISCTNDVETVQALTSELNLPDITGYQIEMAYTDSGVLKGKIFAPEVLQYTRKEDPYFEFPKGMKAVFYDPNGKPASYIQANYAIFYDKKQLWEGRNKVLGENYNTGEKIETEQIFWDQKSKNIYSDKYSTITNADGVFTGEDGFEADEDLRNLKMKGYSGTIKVTEDLSAKGGNQ